uniref:Transmembrane protein n=1 Tax=Strongyloides stercoralis TaxID=6248 RepID=A0A0K0EKL0_STRER
MDAIVLVSNLLNFTLQFTLLAVLFSPLVLAVVTNENFSKKCLSLGNMFWIGKNEKYKVEDPRISLSERMAALNHVDLDYFNAADRTLDSTICSLNNSRRSHRSVSISSSNNVVLNGENISDGEKSDLEVSSRFDAFDTPPSAFRYNVRKARRLGQISKK